MSTKKIVLISFALVVLIGAAFVVPGSSSWSSGY